MKIWLDSFPTPGQKLDPNEKRVKYDHLKTSGQTDTVSYTTTPIISRVAGHTQEALYINNAYSLTDKNDTRQKLRSKRQ